jgi:alanyl-tRNA synthetase
VAERLGELEKTVAKAGREAAGHEAEELASAADDVGGVRVVVAASGVGEGKALLELATRVRDKLGDAVVVLGGLSDGKVALVAVASPHAVERGVSAATIVREAAPVVGGGGGGRDDSAQAGGRDPSKLPDALETARSAIRSALDG